MDVRRWQIAAVVAVGVLVVAGLGLAARSDDGATATVDDDVDRLPVPADDDDDGRAPVDEDDDDDGPAPVEDDLEAFVDEAIELIEATRGRSFVERPVVLVLADEAFVGRLDADIAESFAEEPDLVEEFTVLYRALRLIDADESIDDEYRAFGSAGVLGFYDVETDELIVREGDGLSLLTRSTIVHELVHAFDDQHFNLDRPEYDDLTDEIPWTFSAVTEGSASHVETLWVESLTSAEQRDLALEELGFGDDSLFDEFTLAFLLSEVSVYLEGEPFVGRVIADGGIEALESVLVDPPISSEQVMEPAAWQALESPIEVPLPPADGEIISSGIAGQVTIDALLSEFLFPDDVAAATAGWGGDGFVAWRDGERSCIRWDLVADTESDLEELGDALTVWAEAGADAQVGSPSAGVIRLDSCA